MTDSYNPSIWRGPYIPFKLPFHVESVPSHAPDDEPLVSLCFNEDYLPYVQGALKSCASELTFEGERDTVQAWVQSFMDLLLLEPGSGCAAPLMTWHTHFTYAQASYYYFRQVTSYDSPPTNRVYSGIVFPSALGLDFTFTAKADIDNTDCGGVFRDFNLWVADRSAPLFTVTVTDCNDIPHAYAQYANDFNLFDTTAKSINVVTLEPVAMAYSFEIVPPIICAEA